LDTPGVFGAYNDGRFQQREFAMGKVTDAQVRELRRQLRGGSTLKKAALKADIDRKSARKYREGKMPAERRKERTWRTRMDPLAAVWAEIQRELERAPDTGAIQAASR
jgi:hypothetical protein